MSVVVGKTYGRLTIVSRPKTERGKHSFCDAICSCGVAKRLRCDSIKSGRVVSCGCHKNEVAAALKFKHGHTASRGKISPTYSSWADMLQRCNNENQAVYKYYGARGIAVCDRWHKFENFLSDMGERPVKRTLDRIDNNKGYEPGNCRWATHKEQMANTRGTRLVYIHGRQVPSFVAAEELGIPHGRIYWHVHKRGIPHQQALEMAAARAGKMG